MGLCFLRSCLPPRAREPIKAPCTAVGFRLQPPPPCAPSGSAWPGSSRDLASGSLFAQAARPHLIHLLIFIHLLVIPDTVIVILHPSS